MTSSDVGDGDQPPLIDVSVVINRPIEEVFAFTDNITTEGIWRGELVDSEQLTDGPVGVGTRGRTLWKFMGRTVESTWEIVEYEPNRIVKWRSLEAPTPHTGAWTYEPVEGGTVFRFVVYPAGPDSGWLSGLKERVTTPVLERLFRGDLDNLKRLMEA